MQVVPAINQNRQATAGKENAAVAPLSLRHLLVLVLLLPGCVGTYMRTPQWTVARLSVLSNHTVPSLTVSKDGDAALTGYTGAPDAAAVGALTEGAVKGITRF